MDVKVIGTIKKTLWCKNRKCEHSIALNYTLNSDSAHVEEYLTNIVELTPPEAKTGLTVKPRSR